MQINNFGNESFKIQFDNHILLDDLQSWPAKSLCLLNKMEQRLIEFYDEEKRIDKLLQENQELRIYEPSNCYQSVLQTCIEDITHHIKGMNIIGFHCTRLTQIDIDDILKNGLIPLSASSTIQRLFRLFQAKLISRTSYEAILNKNESSHVYRAGNVCVFHCLDTLKDASGLYRLFRSWGGESVYYNYENNASVGEELRRIGIPCIVIASINLELLNMYPPLEERIVRSYIHKKIPAGFSQDCDSFIKKTVPALQIIQRTDPIFEALTSCNEWRNQI
jgi:hypothetical protein